MDIVSEFCSGIIFSWDTINTEFNGLIKEMINNIAYEEDINIAKGRMVNNIKNRNKKCIVINPYIWYDSKTYCIDILC